jgi:uncharacterized membrane protein YfcA
MSLHDLFLAAIACVSEVLGVLSGFGSSTFFVPVATFFESMNLVLAITAILHCFGNFSKLVIFRQKFDPRFFLKLAIPSVVLAALGAALNSYVSSDIFSKLLGILLIVVALLGLFKKNLMRKIPPGAGLAMVGFSGFVTGLLGTGGAIRGMGLMSLKLEKGAFVFLSSGIDLGGDLLRTSIYVYNGYMDWNQWFYLPLLGLAAYLGTNIGKKVLDKISQDSFEKIVAVFIVAGGLALLVK